MFTKKSYFMLNVRIDIIQWCVFLIALATGIYKLEYPRNVVFDEIHYGRFASLYCNKSYFFDVHPPLGKLLLATGAYFTDYNGPFIFEKIGTPYSDEFPVFGMRLLPAVFGSILVFLIYEIVVLLGLGRFYALLAAIVVICDNALLVQSRFMLVDVFLLVFICLMLLSYLKHKNIAFSMSFSSSWFLWLFCIGMSSVGAVLVKYTALFTVLFVYFLCWKSFWIIIGRYNITNFDLLKHLFARLFALVILPLVIYIGTFYVHLYILSNSGPHDNVMSSPFQSTLKGNWGEGQPIFITRYSQIILRSDSSVKPCWLHSHNALYPLRYSNERGSSHQQQVTCYKYKDVNNWWIVKDLTKSTIDSESVLPLSHGDIIQLIHGTTKNLLNSHNVGAPLTPSCQEVSCYIDHNISAISSNKWRVDIMNREKEGNDWKAITSKVRLIHVDTNTALRVSGKVLPDWGFHQNEVVSDFNLHGDSIMWNVEEHRYIQNYTFKNSSLGSKLVLEMSYFQKFLELQTKMLLSASISEQEHRYRSHPMEWPFLSRNLAYWSNNHNGAQIQLIGNPLIWWSGSFSIVALILSSLLHIFYNKRYGDSTCESSIWEMYFQCAEICIFGYLVNFVPYFLMNETLFLHHYLPALLFKILSMTCLFSYIYDMFCSKTIVHFMYLFIIIILFAFIIKTYLLFLPLSYGYPALSKHQLQDLLWIKSWILMNT